MFLTGSIKLGDIRLGAIFTPEELGQISKREKSMLMFIQQVIFSVKEEYNNAMQKIGYDDELPDLCERLEISFDDFLTDKNRPLLKEINEKVSFILKEIEKSKFSNSLTAARKEKITDAVFVIKEKVKEFEYQNLVDEISQNCPSVEYFYKQKQEKNIQKMALLAEKQNNNRHKTNFGKSFLLFISLLWLGLCFTIFKEADGSGRLAIILTVVTPFAIYWFWKELCNRKKYKQSERYCKRYQEYIQEKSDDNA